MFSSIGVVWHCASSRNSVLSEAYTAFWITHRSLATQVPMESQQWPAAFTQVKHPFWTRQNYGITDLRRCPCGSPVWRYWGVLGYSQLTDKVWFKSPVIYKSEVAWLWLFNSKTYVPHLATLSPYQEFPMTKEEWIPGQPGLPSQMALSQTKQSLKRWLSK